MSENMKQEPLLNPNGERQQTEKRESLSLMATGMAHDFNNFLAAVLGNISIIIKNLPADSSLMKNAAQIEATARKALDLTNHLQAYAGKGEFVMSTIDINHVIKDLTQTLKTAVNPGINIQYALQANLPLIKGDISSIRRIIINLGNNASDAIPEGSGTITISTGITTSTKVTRDDVCMDEIPSGTKYVYIEIKDTGCGITSEARSKVFDPFFTTKIRGEGLGLSIVLGIVRAHGGAIALTSTPGNGSTFRVMFPALDSA